MAPGGSASSRRIVRLAAERTDAARSNPIKGMGKEKGTVKVPFSLPMPRKGFEPPCLSALVPEIYTSLYAVSI
jgi:hypothetical protein